MPAGTEAKRDNSAAPCAGSGTGILRGIPLALVNISAQPWQGSHLLADVLAIAKQGSICYFLLHIDV